MKKAVLAAAVALSLTGCQQLVHEAGITTGSGPVLYEAGGDVRSGIYWDGKHFKGYQGRLKVRVPMTSSQTLQVRGRGRVWCRITVDGKETSFRAAEGSAWC